MRGTFGLFCSFSPKLIRIHVGLHCNAKAVDKTRNMEHSGTFQNIPEHPGTSNNYDNYEKKMCKMKFWACSRDHLERSDWPHDIVSFREQNNFTSKWMRTAGTTFHRGKSIEKYMRSLIFDDILSGGRNVSTEYPLAGSFGAIGSKYKVSGVTSFKRMEDLLPNERKSPSPCCS